MKDAMLSEMACCLSTRALAAAWCSALMDATCSRVALSSWYWCFATRCSCASAHLAISLSWCSCATFSLSMTAVTASISSARSFSRSFSCSFLAFRSSSSAAEIRAASSRMGPSVASMCAMRLSRCSWRATSAWPTRCSSTSTPFSTSSANTASSSDSLFLAYAISCSNLLVQEFAVSFTCVAFCSRWALCSVMSLTVSSSFWTSCFW
mmetsp:Transcript_110637/g.313872  ORF Transcript_110637/g.313872 Transcript_110637/m.313872 type:complete len:208 (+) Transcript_110637:269-892(+)